MWKKVLPYGDHRYIKTCLKHVVFISISKFIQYAYQRCLIRLLWLKNSGISFIKKYKSNVLILNILKLIVTLSYVFVKQSISCIGKTTPCNGHCWNPSYSHICGDNICLNENQLKVWHIFFFSRFR